MLLKLGGEFFCQSLEGALLEGFELPISLFEVLLLLRDGAIPGIEHLLDLDELIHDDIFEFVIFSLLDLAICLFYEVFKGMLQAMLSGK